MFRFNLTSRGLSVDFGGGMGREMDGRFGREGWDMGVPKADPY